MTSVQSVRRIAPGDGRLLRELAAEQALRAFAPQDRAEVDPNHVRDLVRRAVSEDELAGVDGRIRQDDGRITAAVLWTDGVHPLTGHRERVCEQVLVHPSGQNALGELIEAATAIAATDGVAAMRAEVDAAGETGRAAALSAAGFVDHYLVTRRRVTPRPPDPSCRPTTEALRPFAIRCLVDAVLGGLQTGPVTGRDVGREQVEDFVANRWATWDGTTALSYVAIDDEGNPVAHADVRIRTGRHRAAAEAMLNDVYVVPAARGRGWAQRLTAHVEGALQERGVTRIEGTVVLQRGVTPPGLMERLQAAGWWIDRRSMVASFEDGGAG